MFDRFAESIKPAEHDDVGEDVVDDDFHITPDNLEVQSFSYVREEV